MSISRRGFLGTAAACFAGRSLRAANIRASRKENEADARKAFSCYFSKAIALGSDTPVLIRIDAEHLNIFLWLGEHRKGPSDAGEAVEMSRKAVEGILNTYSNVVFAPEYFYDESHPLKAAAGTALSAKQFNEMYSIYYRQERDNLLTAEAIDLLYRSRIPFLIVDVCINTSFYNPQAMQNNLANFYNSDQHPYQRPLGYGLPLSLLFGLGSGYLISKGKTDRRRFLAGAGLAAAGTAEAAFNPIFDPKPLAEPHKTGLKSWSVEDMAVFEIEFRNALIAYKLLCWGRYNHEKTGKKPTIICPMGLYHRDIKVLFKNGEKYSFQVLKKLIGRLKLRQTAGRGYFEHGYLLDTGEQQVRDITFQPIRHLLAGP